MISFKKFNRLVAASVFLLTLLIYLKTVAPTVSFWDSGEFITTSYIFGVPHPPGAPFYTLLGRLFSALPFSDEIAYRVNLVSVLSGAATVLLIYLCVVRLLVAWLDPDDLRDRIAIFTGGAVAAFSAAFSTSFWANSSEAEVYGLSMCITVLAFWLALRWDDGHKDRGSDRLLLFIAYLFGLGAGVHLQCLLTVPGILILVFTDLMEDRPLKTQVLTVVGLIFYPFLAILLPMPLTAMMTLTILVALMLLRPAWRNPRFWMWGAVLAGLGFSTYLALYIRSGLNPIIDMNNPENWENFKAFLARQQYGTHHLFPRRGEFWAYQINIHIKYFLQQFPYFDVFTGSFRRAVSVYGPKAYEVLQFSIIPLLFGVGGAVYHLRRDWKRFASIFAMFSVMGIGLVLYLNMPDPEPREREYIFVGAYTFFGFWMGIGAAGLIAAVGRSLASIPLTGAVAILTLALPAGILEANFFAHDRAGDRISHDYAYNILQTCEQDAILFTNGDNDTYPLWFLQYVKGVRRDIRIVNLSLIKTPWYIQQLRDHEPRVLPADVTDEQIEGWLFAQRWENPPQDMPIAGLTLKPEDIPTALYHDRASNQRVPVVEAHTLMIWRIVVHADWKRPVYFAVTVPNSNLAGLRPYLSMEGMAYRLTKERSLGQFDTRRTAHSLFEAYKYSGIADSTVYKDPVTRRLLGNYLVLFEGLVRAYLQQGLYTEAFQTLRRAEKLVPPHAIDERSAWSFLADRYRDLAKGFAEAGKIDSAVVSLEELLRTTPDLGDREKIEELVRTWRENRDKVIVP